MPIEESVLLKQAQAGNTDAFEALTKPHLSHLLRLIYAVTGNLEDAEDALQETLLLAYQAVSRFRGDATFNTWLHRIALNTTRNWIRSQSRASSQRIGLRMACLCASHPTDPEDHLLASERRDVLRSAILKLPPHYREAILLRHYRNMSYAQIAQVLDVPIGTVRSRIAQGRKLILGELDKSGYLDAAQNR